MLCAGTFARTLILALAVAPVAAGAACGGSSFSGSVTDAGSGGSPDATVEAASEAAAEAAAEAATEAGAEASVDAGSEGGSDTGPDVTGDSPADAHEAGVKDGSVACVDIGVPASSSCTQDAQCSIEIFAPAQAGRYNFGLALDDKFAWWAAQDDYNGHGQGAILRLALSKPAGTPETFSQAGPAPFAVATDGAHVFWLSHGNSGTPPQLRVAPVGCQTPCAGTVIKEYLGHSLWNLERVGSDRLFVVSDEEVDVFQGSATSWTLLHSSSSGSYPSIAVGQNAVFWSSWYVKTLRKFSSGGTLESPFVDFQGGVEEGAEVGPAFIASTCTSVYAVAKGNALWEIDKQTNTQSQIVPALEGDLVGMEADARFVWLRRWNIGGLTRVDRKTNVVAKFSDGNVWTHAVDATHVYFDNHDNGSIRRLVK